MCMKRERETQVKQRLTMFKESIPQDIGGMKDGDTK